MFAKKKAPALAMFLMLTYWGTVDQGLALQASGFQETLVTAGLTSPTAMEFAPDGRLFVAEQPGRLRVIKNGVLQPAPFVTLSVASNSERGMLGVAFDPNFATNGFVYVYYTRSTSPIKNRISRFTASLSNPDVAQANSELVILDNIASDAGNHNGGAIHFGLDGKLYVGVGDGGATSSNAQSLATLSGKLLRINPNGSVPPDNPFVGVSGARGEIWALGLRNPYTFAVDPVTGKIHINDVGQNQWEEVNLGTRGANYGWPTCEGLSCGSNPNFTNPIYTYSHAVGQAITGGAFYRAGQFPSQYVGSYFFSDYLGGFIKRLNTSNQVSDFWSPGNGPVDLKVGPDGALYYLSIFQGAVFKIEVIDGNQDPTASFTATPTSGAAPLAVNFNASGSSDPDGDSITYSWDFGDGTAAGSGVTVSHTYQNSGSYTARLTVNDGNGGTAVASRTISVGTAPVGNILTPTAGTLYTAGSTVSYSGSATDAEDGTLPASRFSWTIVFHHDTHTHPFLGPVNGVTSGSFQIPRTGESSANVFYRIHLTVTDSSGLTHTSTRDVLPRKVTLTLASNPTGRSLTLDGQPVTAPFAFVSVVGFTRTLGAPSPQTGSGQTYNFVSWSDQGAQTHAVNTPATNTTYTATFQTASAPSGLHINFQPAGTGYPGYLLDSGLVYGARGNGQTYGWNVSVADQTRNRNSALSPDERYDTLAHMGNAIWEIAVPNGAYSVHVVVGDPDFADVLSRLTVEGILTINGNTSSTNRWLEATQTVSVNDGRLTIGNQAGSYNKISYIDISAASTDATPPVISGVSASGVTSSTATILWTTNEASDSQVEYGTTIGYGSSTPLNSAGVTSHSQALSGLAANTIYHYRVKSRDAAGNLATSPDFTFTTTAAPPSGFNVRVNFQPAGSAYPAYLIDSGMPFGARGNGFTYGWNLNASGDTRNRNSSLSPDERYDTFAHMGNAVWEIAVPNGTYAVHVVVGDPAYADVVSRLTVEGTMTINGSTTTAIRWLEGTVTVTVTDGRLTIGNLAGSYNKICYVDITIP